MMGMGVKEMQQTAAAMRKTEQQRDFYKSNYEATVKKLLEYRGDAECLRYRLVHNVNIDRHNGYSNNNNSIAGVFRVLTIDGVRRCFYASRGARVVRFDFVTATNLKDTAVELRQPVTHTHTHTRTRVEFCRSLHSLQWCAMRMKVHRQIIRDMKVSHDATWIMTAGLDGRLIVTSAETQSLVLEWVRFFSLLARSLALPTHSSAPVAAVAVKRPGTLELLLLRELPQPFLCCRCQGQRVCV